MPAEKSEPDTGWMALSACFGVPPGVFYPERGGSSADARELCAMCTVSVECLEFALETNEQHGFWGGVSERGRRRIRKQRRLEAGPGEAGVAA